jgi:predicted nucleic acid-binding Zn finger protein
VTAVDDWVAQLESAGELTPEAVDRILSTHGERGQQAIDAVGERRVKEYRDFTVVVGYQDEYIIEGDACNCADSEYNLDTDDPTQLCWHALAAKVARAIGELDEHDMWYSDVRDFL